MGQKHVVKQGDCLSSIARQYGFASWKAIYDHDQNASFRKKRPNPNVIYVGDELFIPDRTAKEVSISPGKPQKVVVGSGATHLRVRVLGTDGKPLAGKGYVLIAREDQLDGTTDSDGIVDHEIAADLDAARISLVIEGVGEVALDLTVGELDPVEEVSGAQARLNNLGFDCGKVDGILGPRTEDAIRRFQADAKLEETGVMNDATRNELKKRHDYKKA